MSFFMDLIRTLRDAFTLFQSPTTAAGKSIRDGLLAAIVVFAQVIAEGDFGAYTPIITGGAMFIIAQMNRHNRTPHE